MEASDEDQRRPPTRSHRYVAVAGLALWVLGLLGLLALWVWRPSQVAPALLAVATFYYAGQFGAFPLGLAAGGEPVLVAVYIWIADAAGLFVFFPFTQYGVDYLHDHPGVLGRWIRRMRERARRRSAFVERYGAWGLFGFTLLPFLFNSPLLGAVIGRVVGLTSRTTLVTLTSAITCMTMIWATVFTLGLDAAGRADARLPWFIGLGSVLITILIAGTLAVVRRRRGGRVA